MSETTHRTRTIEVLVGILATQVIVFALLFYILAEPERIEASQGQILDWHLDAAMTLYAGNCSVCHGLQGEGIGANPPLNSPGLQSMPYDELYKVIARGRFETAMPAWSKEDGGPLSDFEISKLAALIRAGDWQATGDRVVNLGLAPLIPFAADPDPLLLEQVAALPDGAVLQTAIQVYARQCVACHGADGLGTGIAPALNDLQVRAKPADELQRALLYGSPGTLMAGWENVLTPDETSALLVLIRRWDEIPGGAIPAPDVPVPVTTESLVLGEGLFAANCARCHGPEGQGTPRAPALNVKGFLTGVTDQALQQIVILGVPQTSMPAWGDRMSEAEIQAIVGFIRQWEPDAPEVAEPLRPGGGGGGGPPWLRDSQSGGQGRGQGGGRSAWAGQGQDQTTAGAGSARAGEAAGTALPADQHTGAGEGGQDGPPAWAGTGQEQAAYTTAQETSWRKDLDWRILLLATGGLSIAFTLIWLGFAALKGKRPEE
ncbi:MAG: c-type cytochrome [Anaerolineales bacterium]|nr:c-type cytochrome [Anaerolineales bacterium]